MASHQKTSLTVRLLSLITALLLIISAVSCSPAAPAETTAEATTSEETTEAPKSFEINKSFVIVRPDKDDPNEIAAMQLVNRCIKSITGASLGVATDFVKSGEEVKPAEYEILIGATNRKESLEATASLNGDEGLYRIASENVIVIAGGCPAATLEAAIAFCKDIYEYEDDVSSPEHKVISAGTPAELTVGIEAPVSVPMPSIILNGTDLKEYKIVTSLEDKAITAFATAILNACGAKLQIITPESYTDGAAFFLGYVPDEPTDHVSEPFDAYSFYTVANGNRISVDWKKPATASSVLGSLAKEIIPAELKNVNNVTLRDGMTRMYTLNNEYNMLTQVKKTEQKLADGINYWYIEYADRNGLPVKCYAVTVENGAGRLYAGIPNDAATEVSGVTSTTMNTIRATAANGINVIAGFNSGFFDLGGTGLSRGLVVKEGVVAAPNTERPFIAQMKDGSIRILNASNYTAYKHKIQTAVAGNIILMSAGGKIASIAQGTDMAVTRHPRTAAGYNSETGEIVIIEIDGRQPSVSNGASYLDLVTIFRDFGCTDLINLDGGGSSTAIIKDSNGQYVLKNSPSDKSMRKVQDNILIITESK
ncbi:MAG: phosphodiester glycosidase family protein [Clostridia bacterium]|nr:phosphodiester glycosidase family protein [Clostridia bacterium]